MSYKQIIRLCAGIMAISGLTILATTVLPILSYEWHAARSFPILISSLPDGTAPDVEAFGSQDLTKASNWFEGASATDFATNEIGFFTLSIPKLRVDTASVAIGGEDLAKSLIQYPGTALPGKLGNAVIFGHSILPQFFDPENYMSIFSTLHTLKPGDDIIANYDGVTYRYKVETMFEVQPTDLQILDQSRVDSYLTLVTCSPPGHPLKPKRLIVRAKMVPRTTANVN